jgi:membrane-associated protein
MLDFLNPEYLINYGGLLILVAIVFAETGLLIGFFLPGDSLLFVAGLMVGTDKLQSPLPLVLGSVCLAAIIGDSVGYAFGKKVGPMLFKREDSIIFKKKHLEMAKDFYDRNGGFALILGRFVPIIRTFVPIFAGVVKLEYRRFLIYNIVGGVLWVNLMILLGYFLGARFPFVKNNLEIIVIGIIIVSTIPVVMTFIRERKRMRAQRKEEKETK